MKNILQYLCLLVGAIFISKSSFEYIFTHPFMVKALVVASIILGTTLLFSPKIFPKVKGVKGIYIFFLLTNFIFALLLGSFYSTGSFYIAGSYFLALSYSIYQLYVFERTKRLELSLGPKF